MIQRIKIENFRCLQNVEVELKNFNVLVGPNDSGKTTFLDAFKLLQNITQKEIQDWIVIKDKNNKQKISDLLLYHIWQQKPGKKIGIKVDFDEESFYQIALGIDNSFLMIDQECLVLKGKKILEKDPKTSISSSLLKEQRNLSLEASEIKKFLASIKQHTFLPDSLRKPTPPRSIEDGLDTDGFGLAGYMAALKLQEDEIFAHILQTLHEALPRVKTIKVVHNAGENPFELFFTNMDTGINVPASACSDGVLIFLAYLTLLYSPYPPSVLLIEEPENGVHPHRLKSIISYLKKLVQTQVNGKSPQVILTTHSPYLLDYVEADEVLVFHRNQEGATEIKRMSEIPDFQKKSKGFLLGEFWNAFGEEILVKGKWDDDQD